VTDPALNRALGALIGLAVGDALGAPVEFCSRGSFEPVTGMLPSHHRRPPNAVDGRRKTRMEAPITELG
jgi:ADP-ribosylglycohydrolase